MECVLVCDICKSKIARFDHKELSLPLNGRMFTPLYPSPSAPQPFSPLDWADIRCPLCHRRPFVETDCVSTPEGRFVVGDNLPPGVEPEPVIETYEDEELEREWADRMARKEKVDQAVQPSKPGFVCQICGREFKSQPALNGHVSGHTKRGETAEDF